VVIGMSSTASMTLGQGFSKPGVHSLTYKDDFCGFAVELREELLRYPNWKAMKQEGTAGEEMIAPHRQNGITTGHLAEEVWEKLPYCLKFRDFLAASFEALLPLVGADPSAAREVEINAMAYGAGGWLSPHTDFFDYSTTENRLVAWMLYLTDPEDGEWPASKGGAVRVWNAAEQEDRVRPRFNRFAMFRVARNSFHEIEKIAWEPGWANCRLALSGWIQGAAHQKIERGTRMYLESSSAQKRKEEMEAYLQGSLALHRLLAKQKGYCGREVTAASNRISEFEQDYLAHREAPAGTSFIRRVPGRTGCIIVVTETGETVHFGTPEGYGKKLQPGVK
jgi:hypothetical protein